MKNPLGLYVRAKHLNEEKRIIEGMVLSKNKISIMVVDTNDNHYLCKLNPVIMPDDFLSKEELRFVKKMRRSTEGLIKRMSKQ